MPGHLEPKTASTAGDFRRAQWTLPQLRELPKLTKLTLASAIGGTGGTGSGGSTVFGILLALVALAGCVSDETLSPSAVVPPLSQVVSCRATVATGAIDCSGPSGSSTPEILGSQGTQIALRSTGVTYDGSALFQAHVSVQNLTAQPIGTTGTNNSGIDVFFASAPTVTASHGPGSVTLANALTGGTFTGGGQSYFHYADSLTPGGTSPELTWQWNVPSTVDAFVFTVQVSAEVPDFAGVLTWAEAPLFAKDTIVDIAMSSPTRGMAVGKAGVTYRLVGHEWQRLPIQIAEDWVGIDAIGGGAYVGATKQGKVAVYRGGLWHVVRTVSWTIHDVMAQAEDRIVIGGGDLTPVGRVEWLGSGGWQSFSAGSAPVEFVTTVAAGQGAATWADGTRYHFDLNTAGVTEQDILAPTSVHAAASAIGKAEIFGVFWGGAYGYVLTGDGLAWYGAAHDTTVDAVEEGDGYSQFWGAMRNTNTGESVLMYGSGFTTSLVTPLPARVNRIVSDLAGGVFLISDDGIRRWNGVALVPETAGSGSEVPISISSRAGAVYVGTDAGRVWQNVNGSWSVYTVAASPITGIGSDGPWHAFARDGTGEIYTFDGNLWGSVGSYATPGNGFIALGGDDYVFGGGLGATFQFVGVNIGASFTPIVLAGTPWQGLGASSTSNIWAVGVGGKVQSWLTGLGSSGSSIVPGAPDTLFAVATTSQSNTWVGGTAGFLAHWDGGTWTPCTVGTATIHSLWTLGSGVVYVGGATGGLTRVTTSCTKAPVTIAGSGLVKVLSGGSTADLWAIVGNSVYHGTR